MAENEGVKNESSSATEYDSGVYCDFNATVAKAIAGKDILLCLFNVTSDGSTKAGSSLYAISGQKDLSIKRSADTIDITTKDTEGGWKAKLAGTKEWSIDTGGVYATGATSLKELSYAFENSEFICVQIYNKKTQKPMFGGIASIASFDLEAGSEDAVSYSISLEGVGPLKDLTALSDTDAAKITTTVTID